MDLEYSASGMGSIHVGSDEEEQFAVLNLHMDRHQQQQQQHHQYSPVVPDLYSFDPTVSPDNLLMIGPTIGGNNNSNNSDSSSPIYSAAGADQSHLLQCAVEGLIDICTAAKLDCSTPTSSSTPADYPDDRSNNKNPPLPGIMSSIAVSPMASAPNNAQAGDKASSDYCSGRDNPTAAMREMIFRVAAMQPIHIDPESIKRPKRRNVRISEHPQSVAARHRRERISERIRILQRLVPGGTRMDTASMLDEAIHYVKFLKMQVQALQSAGRGGCARCTFNNNYWLGLPNCAAANPNCADDFLMAQSRGCNNNSNCSLS